MDMMLKTLNIDLEVIGWNKHSQRWTGTRAVARVGWGWVPVQFVAAPVIVVLEA